MKHLTNAALVIGLIVASETALVIARFGLSMAIVIGLVMAGCYGVGHAVGAASRPRRCDLPCCSRRKEPANGRHDHCHH